MQLKRFVYEILLLLFIFCQPGIEIVRAQTSPGPQAFLPTTHFEFPPVFEGQEVRHEFVIQNKGAAGLDIMDVQTGWGCTAASYPRQIPPGGEGNIVIRIDSKGMSGHPVQKTITVHTSDPNHEKIELTIGGIVRPIAELSATVIRLTGNAGQEISKTITITPTPENPFKIKNIKAEKGKYFRHELVEKEQPGGGMVYQLTLYNLKQGKGGYTDKLLLQTDSTISPVLEIRVMGFIRDGSW